MVGANEDVWLAVFERGHPRLKSIQRLHHSLPPWRLPRVEGKLCDAFYEGLGCSDTRSIETRTERS